MSMRPRKVYGARFAAQFLTWGAGLRDEIFRDDADPNV